MSAMPAMLTIFYGALPPEVNTARLMAGAGTEPMYQAAAGWEALAISLETQAEELAGSLVALQEMWQGSGGDRAVQATAPMVAWLRTTALQAQKRALQAIAQAAAYTAALATTPPLPEIEMNHVTHATLEATNFLGVNTAPIGVNEDDYFVRMWNQAADAMAGYQAETTLNTVFEPIPPMAPIVMPGVGESTAATAVAQNAALLPGSVFRETAFAHATAGGQVQNVQSAGRQSQATERGTQVATQMVTQMASQVGSMIGQLPQLPQLPQQAMQQLGQPLQQMMQMVGQTGGGSGSDEAQIGLIGTSPLSNHPLAGGSGAGSGAGLIRAAALPGMGGTSIQSPLMSSLVAATTASESVASGAAPGVGGPGLAPVGCGGTPMGAMGQNGRSGGSRPGLKPPSPLPLDDEDEDDW